MDHKFIKMVKGPFAGNIYQQYTGREKTIDNPAYCVSVQLIPGDYYRGIPEAGTSAQRSPGTMPQKYLEANPDMWIKETI